jgi:phenylalanyl-tRNA synthetase beta chain
MKVSYNWLKDYVAFSLSAEEIAEKLTASGLQVEGITRQARTFPNIIVGRIKEVQRHPNADKLSICFVEISPETALSIVCGAPNVVAGAKVPVALEGAELPDGVRITPSKIRGILSQGMICSEKELEISEKTDGIMILPDGTPVGILLSEALRTYGRSSLQEDDILEVAVTPNRGDCLSILGVAREIAALTNVPLKKPTVSLPTEGTNISQLTSVTILAPYLCPRYTASFIRNIAIKSSPTWLKRRLEVVGIRSINNVVDITNYVMIELGQPLHAFDFDKLEERRIVVRQAEDKEKFVTLDQVERVLDRDVLVIADGKKAIGIAGIMGGFNTEVDDTTRHILLESAFFEPIGLRKTSKKLGLHTEASYRFERTVDYQGTPFALKRATQLIQELAGGEIASGIIDEYPDPFPPTQLALRVKRANQILGAELTTRQVGSILSSLEFSVIRIHGNGSDKGDVLDVDVPSHRPDITREIDLIEEVGRIYGYDKILSTLPTGRIVPQEEKASQKMENLIQQILIGEGFYEVIHHSFMSSSSLDKLKIPETDYRKRSVPLANPIVEEQNQLRTTLIPHLLQNVRLNFKYNSDSLRVFEISKVFISKITEQQNFKSLTSIEEKTLPEEPKFVVGAMAGYRNEINWGEARDLVTFFDVKGILENLFSVLKIPYKLQGTDSIPFLHPGQSAEILVENKKIGYLGKIHPEIAEVFELEHPTYIFELNLDQMAPRGLRAVSFKPLPKFPSVHRDLAVLVPMIVRAEEIEALIRSTGGSILEGVQLFDLYKGEQVPKGSISLAYSLVYRDAEKTLTDEEVNWVHNQIVQKLEQTLGVRLRE